MSRRPFYTPWSEIFKARRYKDPLFVVGVIFIIGAYALLIWIG
jgi:hypothetical protein